MKRDMYLLRLLLLQTECEEPKPDPYYFHRCGGVRAE